MADQRILATENMIGANHPTLTDTLNRLTLVSHNTDGTQKFIADTTDSSSVSTGAIITAGGVGIAKNLHVGGTITGNVTGNVTGALTGNADTATTATTATTAANGIAVGTITTFPFKTAPAGYLTADGSNVSRTTYSTLFTALDSPGYTLTAFTVTIASPAVFTSTAHGFTGGERLRLSTTGVLPTGLALLTDYFVSVIDVDTFHLVATIGSANIITTGAQTGIHSYIQSNWGIGDGTTTFTLPDLRGEFIRGWDNTRGVDSNRILGSCQPDDFKSHTHYVSASAAVIPTNGNQAPSVGNVATVSSATGGTETRPRNVALLICIKY